MIEPARYRALALSLPHATEGSHFEAVDFRVANKIFATWREDKQQAVVKLTPDDQALMLETMPGVVLRLPGGWGLKGWSILDLAAAGEDEALHVLTLAWRTVAPKKLVKAQ
jgi:hypothetical protein